MPAPRIHPTAEIENDVTMGDGTAIWSHVHVRSGARIGADCIVGEKTYIAGGVVIGDFVKINAMAYLCAGVTLERGVMVAAGTIFTNDRYPEQRARSSPSCCRPTSVTTHCRHSSARAQPSAPAVSSAAASRSVGSRSWAWGQS